LPPEPTPQWKPITALPTIGFLIDEMLVNAEAHYATIQQARGRPYVFDDAIVERIIQVHTEQLDDHWLFEQQLSRWSQEHLSAMQRRDVERLRTQALKLKEVLQSILAFAGELKEGTLEKVLGKSEIEIAVDFLPGKFRH
jgi:hypothetical protein